MNNKRQVVRQSVVRSDWLWIGIAVGLLVVAWLPLASGGYLSPVKHVEARAQADQAERVYRGQ